jgi:hypothetical protein
MVGRVASVALAVAGAALSTLALTWCGTFSVDDTSVAAEAGVDGGGDAPSEADLLDAPAADAAHVDSGCRVVAGDPLDGPVWQRLGAATKGVNGSVQLTPNTGYQAGEIVHVLDAPLTSLRATIRMRVGKHPQPADGLAFFWGEARDATIGDTGQALAFCGDGGPPGTAVSFVTKPSFDDGGSDTIGIRDPGIAMCADTDKVLIPPLATGIATTFVIEVNMLAMSVAVFDAAHQRVLQATLARQFDIKSVGITAATGGEATDHVLESAVIEVCQ